MPTETQRLARLRLLLVDEDGLVAAGLRRALARLCPSWVIHTASSLAEACHLIEGGDAAIDVVVSDLQMPGCTGEQLLDALRCDRPDIVRISLSRMLNPRAILQAAKIAERRLCKPCPPERLRDEIVSACRARRRQGAVGGG